MKFCLSAMVGTGILSAMTMTQPGPPADRPIGTLSPDSGAWLGAFVNHHGVPRHDTVRRHEEILELEASLGRRLDIAHHYIGWREGLAGRLPSWDSSEGRLSLISWQSPHVRSITSGSEDGWIRAQAKAVRAMGSPILVRWGWEMDIHKDWAVSAPEYVKAWMRIHGLFAEEGATNVAWVWCPTALGFTKGTAQAFYPGHAFVHWVCADGYNKAPGGPYARWRGFPEIFQDFYEWASQTGKPIMIGETGAQERQRGEKADWITEARVAIKEEFPLIQALVYFSSFGSYDWRLTSSSSSLQAFATLASDPYFDPRPALPARDSLPFDTSPTPSSPASPGSSPSDNHAWSLALLLTVLVATALVWLAASSRRGQRGP